VLVFGSSKKPGNCPGCAQVGRMENYELRTLLTFIVEVISSAATSVQTEPGEWHSEGRETVGGWKERENRACVNCS